MASAYTTIVLLPIFLLLLLRPWTTTSNILSPILSPIFDDVCKTVACGKGTCKPSLNSTFFYVCECEAGWKQARSDHDDELKFLPCLIPNCTLNYSCTKAPPPVQDKEKEANFSFFDPCYWADCGGGMCNKTSPFTHTCECQEGYYNLLNTTAFPCFRDCSIGTDCMSLGITGMNNSTSSQTPGLANKDSNQASSISRGSFSWLIITGMSLALVTWNLVAFENA